MKEYTNNFGDTVEFLDDFILHFTLDNGFEAYMDFKKTEVWDDPLFSTVRNNPHIWKRGEIYDDAIQWTSKADVCVNGLMQMLDEGQG